MVNKKNFLFFSAISLISLGLCAQEQTQTEQDTVISAQEPYVVNIPTFLKRLQEQQEDWQATLYGWINPENERAYKKNKTFEQKLALTPPPKDSSKQILSLFPREVFVRIMQYLKPRDILNVAQASKGLRKETQSALNSIDLSDKKLTTQQINAILNRHKGSDVEKIDLSNNDLDDLDWSFLKKCPRLKVLKMGGCNLTQIPQAISLLTNLEELDLNYNGGLNESAVNWEPLRLLKNLKKLDLHGCELNEIPSAISSLTKLKEFNLNHNNDLSQANWELLRPLENLKKLSIVNSELTQIPPAIGSLTNLEELILERNDLSAANWEPLRFLENLRKLDLALCDLRQIPPAISSLITLEELILNNDLHGGSIDPFNLNNLLHANWEPLRFLENLKKLDLKGCPISGIPPAFSYLTDLEMLNVKNSFDELTEEEEAQIDWKRLKSLKNLKKLYINLWGSELQKIKLMFPGVEIT